MFYKTRMRRSLRRIIAAASPEGLRPHRAALAARGIALERAAVAHGLTWHGLSATQAALVIALAAPILCGPAQDEADRLVAAAGRFAIGRGLGAFAAGIARDLARIARRAASRPRIFLLM